MIGLTGRKALAAGLLAAAAAAMGVWFMINGGSSRGEGGVKMKADRDYGTAAAGSAYTGHGGTFKNTLAEIDTPDPSVVYKDGYYYMTFTHNGTDIMVMKSRTIDFRQSERKVVWYPPVDTMYSANLWAPELQYIRGKWYIYFAADNGVNENHRMYALEAETDDPMGSYAFRGQVKDETDKWAIDGLTLEHEGKLYFIWSGWEGDVNIRQNTYIAPMSDPVTISGPRVLLSEPELDFEKAGGPPYINEGQSILKKDGRVFLVYSGAGSWTPFYSLGMLTLEAGADPLVAANWTKAQEPLLAMDEAAGVYGPGHNSFVKSPDGTEDWIVYHATAGATDGWNNRKARAQKVQWSADGKPVFGKPLALSTAIPVPAGTGLMQGKDGLEKDGRLAFDLIPSAIDGEAPLLLHYRNPTGQEIRAEIRVEGGEPVQVALPATEDGVGGTAYASVTLKSGMNTISLPVPSGWKLDALEIPRFEAELAQGFGSAEAEDNPFASGGGVAKLPPEASASLRFLNVAVPADASYKVRIAAANTSGKAQPVDLVTADGRRVTLSVPSAGRNVFSVVETELSFHAGRIDLTLEYAGAELTVDYIDVVR